MVSACDAACSAASYWPFRKAGVSQAIRICRSLFFTHWRPWTRIGYAFPASSRNMFPVMPMPSRVQIRDSQGHWAHSRIRARPACCQPSSVRIKKLAMPPMHCSISR